jgi:hypothetical protein
MLTGQLQRQGFAACYICRSVRCVLSAAAGHDEMQLATALDNASKITRPAHDESAKKRHEKVTGHRHDASILKNVPKRHVNTAASHSTVTMRGTVTMKETTCTKCHV